MRRRATVGPLLRPVSPLSPSVARRVSHQLHVARAKIPRTMSEIDVEALIAAVKKRPALYNKNDPNYYSNKKHKARMWIETCKEVFSDWDNFKPQDKVEHVHELQRRWKSLRTCFTRELGLQKKERMERDQKEGPFKKRKRYEYFNVMSFLLEPGDENTVDRERDSDDDSSDPDPLESIKTESSVYDSSMHVSNSNHYEIEAEQEPGPTNATFLRPIYERSENLEDKILDMLKDIKKDEEDEDRQFMLSLVPSFRKLKPKQKFEARIEVLRVLKDITFQDDDDSKPNSAN